MTYDSGVARAAYILDITQPRQAAAELRALFQDMKADTATAPQAVLAPPTAGVQAYVAGLKEVAPAIQKDEQATLRYATSLAATQKAQGDLTGAATTYRTALAQLTPNTLEANRAAALLATTESALAKEAAAAAGNTGVGALTAELTGLISPATLAIGALGVAVKVGESFKEAFDFKAQLDSTNASIALSLQGVRDISQTFDEAAQFANRYKLTQEETAAAIQASIPILRSSNASLTDVESTLLRLQAKKPEKSIADAARALDELKSGQIISIVDQFNVSRDAANKMKNEIASGGDAVKILSDYLTTAGYGMEALEIRTKGATGAINDAKVASEELKIAQGEFANGPGVVITETYTGVLKILTNALTEGTDAQKVFNAAVADQPTGPSSGGGGAFDFVPDPAVIEQAIAQAKRIGGAFDEDRQALGLLQITLGTTRGEMERSAQASVNDTAAKEAQTAKTALLAAESNNAVNSFLALNPQIDASGVAALIAAGKLDAEIGRLAALRVEAQGAKDELIKLNNANAQAKLDQLVTLRRSEGIGSGRGGGSDAAAEGQAFADALGRQAQAAAQAAADAKKRLDDQIAYAKATNDTTTARRLLNQELANAKKAGDLGEQARVIDAIKELDKKGSTGRISAAQSTGLQLQSVEENTQAQLLKTQREGLERLRDQEQDFDLKRSRSKEDEDAKIQGLLARGQRAAAARERADFATRQRRDQEDFDIQRRRTLRNNAESSGDITSSADRRTGQIDARAALRGVRPAGGAAVSTPSLPGLPAAAATQTRAATLTIQGVINLDGKQIGTAAFPTIEVMMDESLAISLTQIGVPNAGQLAVGGPG